MICALQVGVSRYSRKQSETTLFTCDQACISEITAVGQGGRVTMFSIRPTNPSTPILYIASEEKQLILLRYGLLTETWLKFLMKRRNINASFFKGKKEMIGTAMEESWSLRFTQKTTQKTTTDNVTADNTFDTTNWHMSHCSITDTHFTSESRNFQHGTHKQQVHLITTRNPNKHYKRQVHQGFVIYLILNHCV